MKSYDGSTIEAALKKAAADTGKSVEELKSIAVKISERKTLFGITYTIGLFNHNDVYDFCVDYLKKILGIMKVDATISMKYDHASHMITIDMTSNAGSELIGKNGENLKSINILVRSAAFNKFGDTYKILLDCNNYKNDKYAKIRKFARLAAEDVLKSHIPSVLPPMTADERREVHEELQGMKDISADSVDTGAKRHIVITYMPGNVTEFGIKTKDNTKNH